MVSKSKVRVRPHIFLFVITHTLCLKLPSCTFLLRYAAILLRSHLPLSLLDTNSEVLALFLHDSSGTVEKKSLKL
jgi:hypothetical protein